MEVELRTAVDEQRERLCARFVDALFVSGASITVFGHQNRQTLVCASSPAASLNSTLQRRLHEGPHWDAYRSGVPTLCPSLPDADPLLWPAFADAAVNRGIIAVFAFPMRLGAAVVGVVDLHARRSRRLDAHQISMASSMANRFAATAEALAAESSALEPALLARVSSPMPREVHQQPGSYSRN